jgi:hypothetical protein
VANGSALIFFAKTDINIFPDFVQLTHARVIRKIPKGIKNKIPLLYREMDITRPIKYEIYANADLTYADYAIVKYYDSHNGKVTYNLCFNSVRDCECLKYLYEQCGELRNFFSRLCDLAAEHGQLECLRFLHSTGRLMLSVYHIIICKGQIDCLKWAHEEKLIPQFNNHACSIVEHYGQWECLSYLRENGYEYEQGFCINDKCASAHHKINVSDIHK